MCRYNGYGITAVKRLYYLHPASGTEGWLYPSTFGLIPIS